MVCLALKLILNWYDTCHSSGTKMHVRNDRRTIDVFRHHSLAPLVGDNLDPWEFKFAKLVGERPLNIEMFKLQNCMHC